MASKKKPSVTSECPSCGADTFQYFERGQFVDGKFQQTREVAQCLGCHSQYESGEKSIADQLRARRPVTNEPLEVIEA